MAASFYVKTGCPYCAAMRKDLDGRGVSYDEINVGDSPEVIPELLKLTGGKRIVPVLAEGTKISVAPDGG